MRATLKACGFAALLLASPVTAQEAAPDATPAHAADMIGPRVSLLEADWHAARAALAGLDRPAVHDAAAGAAASDPLARLNAATGKVFPDIARSPVPVLLPFDSAVLLRDQAQSVAADDSRYFSAFHAPTFFYPGPAGYDAVFSLEPQDAGRLDLDFAKRVDVQISGLALVYELDGDAAEGSPVTELEREFPGIRRILLESHVRYAFVRFGVPYVVSILCFEGPARGRRLSCRQADKVAARFLRALNIAGGAPPRQPAAPPPPTIERPAQTSPDFTYFAPGDILPGTGVHGQGGRADATVYAKIRFPTARAPAYTNSQSFMNLGNCDLTGRVALGGSGKDGAYRCRVNAVPLVKDETKNYAYPWRDNFCEHRYYYVTQCPAGLGHQGEDIRPSACKLRNEGANHCEPYQDNVVAVRDGLILRDPGDKALYLVVDQPGEHIRFRYLHLNPHMLDAAGMINGRALAAGDVIGPVGDFGVREGGTTYHLHFDLQVPTRRGWLFVNPYMTLVAAYERLIGGRGTVVSDATRAAVQDGAGASGRLASGPAAPGATEAVSGPDSSATSPGQSAATPNHAVPDIIATPSAGADATAGHGTAPNGETRSERARSKHRAGRGAHCKTRFAQGHRRRACGIVVAGRRWRANHAHAVRAVDRRISRQGHGARRHAANLRSRHEHAKARHHRA